MLTSGCFPAVLHVERDGPDDDLGQGAECPSQPSRESVVQETVPQVPDDDLREDDLDRQQTVIDGYWWGLAKRSIQLG
ncbi:hypothetical protein GCM10010430_69600 [Kitasatospora cystarginea]|uniref:Uncharacterized protein n=1 Tax=Kitasatospora cystarginea TaxID=58350 RepID=A0ABN3EWI1_9ACTN